MKNFCVQCKKKVDALKAKSGRCEDCFKKWDAAGRVHRELKVTKGEGFSIGGYVFRNFAKWCKLCGGMLNVKSSVRVQFALRRGNECQTCDDCHFTSKLH